MQKKTLLIATKNVGKFGEFVNFLSDIPKIKLFSLKNVGINEDVEEDGSTYFENSLKKAMFYAKRAKMPVISDDGGIEIEALGGTPGIKSRRWIGHEATDEELIKHMKNVSKNLPDDNRDAYFRAVVTLALPDGRYFQETGEVKGIIAKKPLLKYLKGYPYRSFFYIPEIKKYYHESDLTEEEQKLYNHRYKAIQKLKPIIKRELGLKD